MNTPGTGHESTLLIGQESVYATPPGTADAKYEFASMDYDANQSVILNPNMTSDGASPRSIVQGLQFVTGSFRLAIGFKGFESLWRFVLPTYAFDNDNPVVGVNQHSFKEGSNLGGHTLEFSWGNLPTGKVTRYVGCVCTGFRLATAGTDGEGGVIMAEIQFAGFGAPTPDQTPMTFAGSIVNVDMVPFHFMLRTAGALKDGSGATETDIEIRSLAISLGYPHNTRRGFLGSLWAGKPVRNGPLAARAEIEYDWDNVSYAMMTKLITNAPAAGGLLFKFQSPTIITGTTHPELHIKAGSPVAGGHTVSVPGPGEIGQRIGWALAKNATDASCLVVTTQNDAATL